MDSDTGSGLGLGACNGITIDRRVQLLLSNLARRSLSLNLSSCDSPHAPIYTHTHTSKQHLRLANDLQNQRSRPWAPTGSTIVSIATWRWFHAQAPKNSQLKRQCVCGRCVCCAGYARCVRGCVWVCLCCAERQPTVSADKSQTKAVNLKLLCFAYSVYDTL